MQSVRRINTEELQQRCRTRTYCTARALNIYKQAFITSGNIFSSFKVKPQILLGCVLVQRAFYSQHQMSDASERCWGRWRDPICPWSFLSICIFMLQPGWFKYCLKKKCKRFALCCELRRLLEPPSSSKGERSEYKALIFTFVFILVLFRMLTSSLALESQKEIRIVDWITQQSIGLEMRHATPLPDLNGLTRWINVESS